MILFPAIDLKDGKCVRLKLGDMNQATIYNDSPADQAMAFEQQGFNWLHVVDLNGAFEGQSVNGAAVEAILKATKNPVQLGGGIRTLAHIESWLNKGLARVILGTIAVRDPALVKEACKKFPGKIAVGIDAKGGKAAVEGWAEASTLGIIELAQKFEGAGVAAIIYTDIDRDGILTGINRRRNKDGKLWASMQIEDREGAIVLLVADRIVRVAVALCASDRRALPDGPGRVHPVHDGGDTELFVVGAAFRIRHRVAMETRRDPLPFGRVRQQVARELLNGELVEGEVVVERLDDPIAIPPHGPIRVRFVPLRVCIACQIQPHRGPPFAEVR